MKHKQDIEKMHVLLADGGLIELLYADGERLTPIATFEVTDDALEDEWFEFIYKDEPYDLNIWSIFSEEEGEHMGATIYEVILDGDTYDTDTAEWVTIGIRES